MRATAACHSHVKAMSVLTQLILTAANPAGEEEIVSCRSTALPMRINCAYVRLVDPRVVAVLVKQGWLARDGHSFCLTVPPLTESYSMGQS